jgi:voltage-gated potassium channel
MKWPSREDATARISDVWRRVLARRRASWRSAKLFSRALWRENVPQLALSILALFALSSLVVGVVEYYNNNSFGGPLNAFYWSVVTLATTGYGDVVPRSTLGRTLTMVFILMGMVMIAVFTATLASVFTAKKIKEGRGLEKVKASEHIVICGWSRHLDSVLRFLARAEHWRGKAFVLINAKPEAEMNEVLYHYNQLDMSFVHGDFLQESVLRRANIGDATAAIIVADEESDDLSRLDSRTLQAALAIKEMNPDIEIVAEALDPDNEQHLRRANVDDIIVSGEFTGYMIAASTVSPSLHGAIQEIFSVDLGNDMIKNPIPEDLRGKTFGDVHTWFRQHGALAIGIITEDPGLSLDTVLDDDFSTIDRFIRTAFTAAGKDLAIRGEGKPEVLVNPADDRVIGPNDDAIILAPRQVEV